MLHYSLVLPTKYCAKTQKTVDISESWYYHRLIKYEQRRLYRNGSFCQVRELNKGMG